MTTVVKKKKATNSYQTYIHKLLKKVHPECQISSMAISQLDDLVKTVARTLSSSARESCLRVNKGTVASKEIILATELYLPQGLRNDAKDVIENAISQYGDTSEKKKSGDSEGPSRREIQAGLLFAVSLAEKFIRDFGQSSLFVSKDASIALAAVLEYITSVILQNAGDEIMKGKKVTLSVRSIYLAIQNSSELSYFVGSLNFEFIGGGVVPYINPHLIPTKEQKAQQAARRKKNASGNKKSDGHKFLPGTKSLMEIKKAQKNTSLELQKLPFENQIRELADQLKTTDKSIQFQEGSITMIQNFVEQRVTNLCSTAVSLAVHAKRDGVGGADINLAWKISESTIPFNETEKLNIGNNGIERLAFRGGVKRKNADMYDAVRHYMYSLVRMVLHKTLLFMYQRKVITVKFKDIQDGIGAMGINVAISNPPKKTQARKPAVPAPVKASKPTPPKKIPSKKAPSKKPSAAKKAPPKKASGKKGIKKVPSKKGSGSKKK